MLVTRAILFKTYLVSADMSARVAVVKLHLKDLEARIQKAKLANDTVTVLRGTQEMKQAFKSAGINVWKGLGPFINIPFGYGTFRLTRNMATLPVPGLETGGVLWFYDLTVADPYFILPILTGAGTYLMFKVRLQQRTTLQPFANLVAPSLEARQAHVAAFLVPRSK